MAEASSKFPDQWQFAWPKAEVRKGRPKNQLAAPVRRAR
jgi:hypothetical protein